MYLLAVVAPQVVSHYRLLPPAYIWFLFWTQPSPPAQRHTATQDMGQLQQQESEEPAQVVVALPISPDAMVKSSSDPIDEVFRTDAFVC